MPVPYKLVDKHGSSCTVESPEGVPYKSNNTHVKRYQESLDDTPEIEDILPQTTDNHRKRKGPSFSCQVRMKHYFFDEIPTF